MVIAWWEDAVAPRLLQALCRREGPEATKSDFGTDSTRIFFRSAPSFGRSVCSLLCVRKLRTKRSKRSIRGAQSLHSLTDQAGLHLCSRKYRGELQESHPSSHPSSHHRSYWRSHWFVHRRIHWRSHWRSHWRIHQGKPLEELLESYRRCHCI